MLFILKTLQQERKIIQFCLISSYAKGNMIHEKGGKHECRVAHDCIYGYCQWVASIWLGAMTDRTLYKQWSTLTFMWPQLPQL